MHGGSRFERGGTRQGGVHLAHFAGLAFELIAEDVGMQAHAAGEIGSCFERLLGRGDQVHRVVGKHGIAGLGSFQYTGLQRFENEIGLQR